MKTKNKEEIINELQEKIKYSNLLDKKIEKKIKDLREEQIRNMNFRVGIQTALQELGVEI